MSVVRGRPPPRGVEPPRSPACPTAVTATPLASDSAMTPSRATRGGTRRATGSAVRLPAVVATAATTQPHHGQAGAPPGATSCRCASVTRHNTTQNGCIVAVNDGLFQRLTMAYTAIGGAPSATEEFSRPIVAPAAVRVPGPRLQSMWRHRPGTMSAHASAAYTLTTSTAASGPSMIATSGAMMMPKPMPTTRCATVATASAAHVTSRDSSGGTRTSFRAARLEAIRRPGAPAQRGSATVGSCPRRRFVRSTPSPS